MKSKSRRKRVRGRNSGDSRKGVLETIHLNASGIDIGGKSHWVAVPPDRSESSVREFKCFTPDLHAIADWLEECGIDTVAMESTGVYWVPLYENLEERGFEIELTAQRLARYVWLELPGSDVVFSDNYFDIPAGRTVRVSLPAEDGVTVSQARSALRVRSLADSY